MKTSDFDYVLPVGQIAQQSVQPRDHSKLMVVSRQDHSVQHRQFFHIVEYLRPGDVLVWNNSKVFKARLRAKLLTPKGDDLWEHTRDGEIFLVRPKKNEGVWQVLAKPGRHVKNGMRVEIASDFYGDVMLKEKDGTILIQFFGKSGHPLSPQQVRERANAYGSIPIPPYVKDEPHQLDSYQTVYAAHEGSVAAPTAGFHFTPELIEQIKAKGVEFAEITLHVGLGTFLPVKTERIEDHTMHSESVEITAENAEKINRAKKEGRRVIAVGTTTVRTLEGVHQMFKFQISNSKHTYIHSYIGDINIFITHGFEFQVVDALITNFHLPKSTLLMLVSAFVGDRKFMLECYKMAVEEKYRFFSFGDAMFIK